MVYFLLLLATFLFGLIRAQGSSFVFPQNETALYICFENFFLNSNDSYYKEIGIASVIAHRMAKRFSGKTKNKFDLIKSNNNLFYEFRDRKLFNFQDRDIYKPLQSEMIKALIHCNSQPNYIAQTVPIFTNEPREVANLLDYILVDWSEPLKEMIRTRNGRALLRRYAEDAGVRLAIALRSIKNHDAFRYLLRSYWMARAQYFFNGYDQRVPFLRYHYTLEFPFPHTYNNQTQLSIRHAVPLRNRNPFVPPKYFKRIMSIHVADRPSYGEDDPFFLSEKSGVMTRARYYIETHIDQFYRILFFFMELQIEGISTDEDDVYDGTLPYYVAPTKLQAIVYHDLTYRDYLLSLRKQLELAMHNPRFQIDIKQSLSSARVHEEDLITLLSVWIQYIPFGKNTNNTEIVFSFMSTTPKYDDTKRKGNFFNGDGKRLCPASKTMSSDKTQKHTQSNGNSYGYMTYSDDLENKLDFETKDFFIFVKSEFSLLTPSSMENIICY